MSDSQGGRFHGIFGKVPPRVKGLIYLTSFASVGYGYLLVAITAYLPELGLSSGIVGLMLGVNGASFVVSAIPLGMLSDRIGRKKILIGGLVGISPTLLIFGLTTDPMVLIITAGIAGTAEGAFLTSWNALIADLTVVENRDEAFSLSFILGSATMGLGFALPFVFPWLEDLTGLDSYTVHSAAFIVLAVLSAISPIALWGLLKDYAEPRENGVKFVKGKSMGLLLRFSSLSCLIGFGAGFIIPLIPTWLFLKFGVPDTFSGPLLAVAGITIGLAAIGSAALARRVGTIRAVVLTQGLSTVFMFSLAFVPGAALAGVLYVIRAALMNMAGPLLDSFLMGIISKEERGLASAVNSLVWRLPNSITTFAGGMLLAAGIFDLPFYIATVFYVVAVILYYKMFKDVKPTN